jgi:ferredoxin
MILERLHYVPIGWWKWAKVRMRLFGYRLSGGFNKRIGLHPHFEMVNSLQESLSFKPKIRSSFISEELELARLACPVDAISGQGNNWKIDLLRCHCCQLCIKLAPHSLELEKDAAEAINLF